MKLENKKYGLMEGLDLLEIQQLLEVCKFFNVNIVDKSDSILDEENKLDLKKVKLRRDFDVMKNEVRAEYIKLRRRNRRQIDRIIDKIIRANNNAREIIYNKQKEQYEIALNEKDKVLNYIAREASGDDDNG